MTLDEDVAARLAEESRKTGQPFKTVVNETLRLGLDVKPPKARTGKRRFVWRETKLDLIPFESTSEMLERLDAAERPDDSSRR